MLRPSALMPVLASLALASASFAAPPATGYSFRQAGSKAWIMRHSQAPQPGFGDRAFDPTDEPIAFGFPDDSGVSDPVRNDAWWFADPDLDRDGLIGFGDYLLVMSNWGACAGGLFDDQVEKACATDLNRDGFTDLQDLLVILALWGTGV